MKSEQRHELQKNDLGKFALKLGEEFEAYGNQILLGLAAVLLVAGAVIWSVRSSDAKKSDGWNAYSAATSADGYETVADEYEGSEVGSWARLSAAESYLESGIQMSFTDREASVDELETSRKNFEKLLNGNPIPAIRERALIGMARYLEVTSDGDNSEAIDTYKKFLSEFPNSIYKELAENRADALITGSAQDFYAWFHKQNPKPQDRSTPNDGLPEGHPDVNPFDAMSRNSFGPTGIDRWATPEFIPDLLTVPGMDDQGPEISFPPEPDAPESSDSSSDDSSETKDDSKKDE